MKISSLLSTASMWNGFLVGSTLVLSALLACVTPFAALAALCALFMTKKEGLFAVLLLWVCNQAIGYGFLHYPYTLDSFAWGIAIAASGILAFIVAFYSVKILEERSQMLKAGVAFISALFVQQGVIYLPSFFLSTSSAAYSLETLNFILLTNGALFISLYLLYQMGSLLGFTGQDIVKLKNTKA